MSKLPWMNFHTGDWLKDPKLSMCLPATRGIWADAIACMHEDSRSGTLSGTPCQLARALRCTESDLMSAIMDLQTTGAANITERHGIITLTNRRMFREAKEREDNRLRQQVKRARDDCAENVTPMSLLGNGNGSFLLFERFYKAYPRKENPIRAKEEFYKSGITEEIMPRILDWIAQACQSEQWQDKKMIPHPSTWLHQRRWEGDPPPWAHDKTVPLDTSWIMDDGLPHGAK